MSSVIRCDASPQEVVAWKSPINEPSYGSQILVQETQIAILLESGKLVGKLDSGIYPIESRIYPFSNDCFQEEVLLFHMTFGL